MINPFKKKEYTPKEWTVIMIGETKIIENSFPVDHFNHPERLYAKAEEVPNMPENTVNDVYYLYHLNDIKKIAVYFKHKV